MSRAATFKFDVSNALEKLLYDCKYEGHDEDQFLHAVIDEIDDYLAEAIKPQKASCLTHEKAVISKTL